MKFLIIGLGNIGVEYTATRHNIGFMVVDFLATQKEITFKTARLGEIAELKHKGKQIYLLKPSTYMNLSGKAVNYWLQELKIPLENCLIITDDLALPYGKIRMRGKGSDGGHNGLKNIQEVLQTQNYARMRMGIGNEFAKGKQIDYVLGEFDEEERKNLDILLKKANEAIFSFCLEGLSIAMNKFNT
ncbi:MAG: aminoacyl-tRNA hydrolase [Thermonemataceae bacterium]|nr:aminoacyl-tRNA hydrolase [Thermonemataceae bacterium]